MIEEVITRIEDSTKVDKYGNHWAVVFYYHNNKEQHINVFDRGLYPMLVPGNIVCIEKNGTRPYAGKQIDNLEVVQVKVGDLPPKVSTVESGGDSTTRPTVSTPSESSERQASIEWQNARTNAVNLVVGFKDKFFEWSWPEILSTVIDTQQSLYSGTIKVNLEQAKEILETNQPKTGTKK